MKLRLKTLMPAATAVLLMLAAQAAPVRAETVLSFSGASFTASGSSGLFSGSTTISTGGAEHVTITSFNGSSTPFSAWLNLNETSSSGASSGSGSITQEFNGSFTITSGKNGNGTNYLSGNITGITFTGSGSSAHGGLESDDHVHIERDLQPVSAERSQFQPKQRVTRREHHELSRLS